MDTDGHGFYRAEDYIIYSPTDCTDEHGFLPCGWWVLNTRFVEDPLTNGK